MKWNTHQSTPFNICMFDLPLIHVIMCTYHQVCWPPRTGGRSTVRSRRLTPPTTTKSSRTPWTSELSSRKTFFKCWARGNMCPISPQIPFYPLFFCFPLLPHSYILFFISMTCFNGWLIDWLIDPGWTVWSTAATRRFSTTFDSCSQTVYRYAWGAFLILCSIRSTASLNNIIIILIGWKRLGIDLDMFFWNIFARSKFLLWYLRSFPKIGCWSVHWFAVHCFHTPK